MKRRISGELRSLSIIMVLVLLLAIPAAAAPVRAKVFVHELELCSCPLSYRIGDTTYVPLQQFMQALEPDAVLTRNEDTGTVTVSLRTFTFQVYEDREYMTANGRCFYLYDKVSCFRGSLMVPVEPLAAALGVTTQWDPAQETLAVSGSVKTPEAGDSYYDADSLYWLSHIIQAEAGCESLEGKIAVGNVVLNRMARPVWPDTVYEVVFDRRCGVQFSPTSTDAIYREPGEEAVLAAKLALEGANIAGNSLYFLNPVVSSSTWFEENLDYVMTIGRHAFYTEK